MGEDGRCCVTFTDWMAVVCVVAVVVGVLFLVATGPLDLGLDDDDRPRA